MFSFSVPDSGIAKIPLGDSASREVTVVEVGPRDGLQMEKQFVPTEVKVKLINQIAHSGVRKIETTSFVHPDVIPQMRDAADVLRDVDRTAGTCYLALVPNVKGASRAIEAHADAVKMVLAVTESSNQKNVRMSVKSSLAQCEEILRLADQSRTPAEVVVSVAFGCPYEGDVPDEKVLSVVSSLASMGFHEISVADTVGVAHPLSVRRLSSLLIQHFPTTHFSLHFHNTRGLGLANVLAGMASGIDQFDSSFGGLGGCPLVQGGKGNVASEDLVNMLDEMSIPTGVSLTEIMTAARMAQDFLQRPFPSHVLSAGTRKDLYQQYRFSS
jgi:hydroxymethylglutaryl-CoA lyase